MSRPVIACVSLVLWAGSAVIAAGQVHDPRSHQLLRLDCATELSRSEVTLFGNGTLRLREGEVGAEEMALTELNFDIFEAYVRRLQQESLGNGLKPPPQIEGQWTEHCVLALDIPEGPVGEAAFATFDSLSLPLSRVVSIARELQVLARVPTHADGIPVGFIPARGDVLIHRDGGRYRVHGHTSDGTGLELMGLDQPLIIYMAIDQLHAHFLAVEGSP